jgi:hypothetical protein
MAELLGRVRRKMLRVGLPPVLADLEDPADIAGLEVPAGRDA